MPVSLRRPPCCRIHKRSRLASYENCRSRTWCLHAPAPAWCPGPPGLPVARNPEGTPSPERSVAISLRTGEALGTPFQCFRRRTRSMTMCWKNRFEAFAVEHPLRQRGWGAIWRAEFKFNAKSWSNIGKGQARKSSARLSKEIVGLPQV